MGHLKLSRRRKPATMIRLSFLRLRYENVKPVLEVKPPEVNVPTISVACGNKASEAHGAGI